jgi:hypothetical protein
MFQTGNNKITSLTECESVIRKVLFGNAVLAVFMSGRKYDFKLENGDCLIESNIRTLVFQNKVRYKTATLLDNSVLKRSTFKQTTNSMV